MNKRCDALAKQIHEAGGDALVIGLDVNDRSQVKSMIDATLQRFGRADIFVNNAAIMKGGSLR